MPPDPASPDRCWGERPCVIGAPRGVRGGSFPLAEELVRPAPWRPQHRHRLAGHPGPEPAAAPRRGAVHHRRRLLLPPQARRALRRRAGPDPERVPHPGGLDPAAPLRRRRRHRVPATWWPSWSSCSPSTPRSPTRVYRSAGRRHDRAVDFWLLFVPLVGPLSYVRFDMLPGGPGRRRAARRPAPTLGHRRADRAGRGDQALARPADPGLPRRQARPPAGRASPSWSSASAWPPISLLAGGMTRLFSPLTWQSDRGLQIESIWSIPLMVARAVRPGRLGGRDLPLPGVRDLRSGRGVLGRSQQRGHRGRAGHAGGAVRPGVPGRWRHPGGGRRSWCWPPSR